MADFVSDIASVRDADDPWVADFVAEMALLIAAVEACVADRMRPTTFVTTAAEACVAASARLLITPEELTALVMSGRTGKERPIRIV